MSCFGKKKEYNQFIDEYNDLFNSSDGKKKLNIDRFLLRLYIKHQKLRAMYDSLTTCEGVNAKEEFKLMFKREYQNTEDLKLITNLAEQVSQKMNNLKPHEDVKEGVSFVSLINIVEISRGIEINRGVKLYEFYNMYQTELTKWNK